MTVDQVRRFFNATPFLPFSIRMPDGRSIHVPHKDFMFLTPSGRVVVIAHADDSVNVIDTFLITDLEVKAGGIPTSNGPASAQSPSRKRSLTSSGCRSKYQVNPEKNSCSCPSPSSPMRAADGL